jgi:hypothetical protein
VHALQIRTLLADEDGSRLGNHTALYTPETPRASGRDRISNQGKAIWEILIPYPPDLKLQEILELAERIRVLLPLLAGVRFKEEQTIMFVATGDGTL